MNASKVVAGSHHTLALAVDSTVWTWGDNESGQLGDGTTTNRSAPVQVGGLAGAMAVAGGYSHSLAVKSDGTVWAWGRNSDGQLGDATTTDRNAPVQVGGLMGAVAVAGGFGHSLAVKSDGTVWAWGGNSWGQLGVGMSVNRSAPVQVSGLTGVVAVATGQIHSLAVKSDGTVWAWGWNESGQLGDGTTTVRPTPVQVVGLTGVVAVAAGYGHSMALKGDGTVWAWGGNSWGQLGDGSRLDRSTPSQVIGLTGMVAVAAGDYHCLAVKHDGTVWAWGVNFNGQLGDGSRLDRSTPSQVSGLTGVVAVAAGNSHSPAVKSDGTVWAWGANSNGQLGDGSRLDRSTPSQVSGLTGVVAVAAGQYHSLAVKSDGTVWAWGRNTYWQLGDGTVITRNAPVQVGGLTGVVAVAAGNGHSLVLKSDGTVWAWGYNAYGQLGDGTTIWRNAPAQVSGLTGVVAVAAGGNHSLAVKRDGTVWAWGWNEFGQLGDGTTTSRIAPVQVGGLTGVVAAAAGQAHNLALKSGGTVWAWGYNAYGQLGDGTATSRNAPVQVGGLMGVASVAASPAHSMALKSDGTVWAWGSNGDGRLGDGTTTDRNAPVQVRGLTGVVALAVAAGSHSLSVRNDGTVWAWGYNAYGQLGDGTTTLLRTTPVQVGGLTGLVAAAGGYVNSFALKSDGTIWAWGHNGDLLGDGIDSIEPIPVPVVPLGSRDLTISKSHVGTFAVGTPSTYNLSVTNVGYTATSGPITVTDTLPTGLLNPGGFGDNWSCSAAGRIVTCTNPGPIQPGATSTITLNVDVAQAAYPGVTNIATVSNASDLNVSNNNTGDPLYVTGTGCSYSVTPASTAFPVSGGSASFSIQTDSSCPWTVLNLPAWISVSGSNNGTGPGAITLNAASNPGVARSASVVIAGVPITLTQETFICTYSLGMVGQTVSSSGGTGSVEVITGSGCPWTASSPAAWLVLTSGTTGAGGSRVYFQASANNSASSRSTTLTVAGRAFTVEQAGTLPGSATFAGGLPQIASGEGWKTTFTITNIGSSSTTIRLNYWGNDGSALVLPMSFPLTATAGLIQGTTIDRTIDAGATLIIESEASAAAPVLVGWAELLSTGPVTGLAVFRQSSNGREQEGAVPLETRTASMYLLQFDNVSGYATGIAAANHSTSPVNLTLIQRDEAGRQIVTESLPLAARGHASFDLKARWPSLANRRGTIEVRGSMPGSFSILGLRFHPQGPFTTLPVAAK